MTASRESAGGPHVTLAGWAPLRANLRQGDKGGQPDMKIIALAAAFALTATASLAADPIEGIWQTQPDEGSVALVQIAPCGAAYCGTIVRTFKGSEEYKSPNIGKQIVIDMVASGGGAYAGKVLRPADNKIYNGKAAVSGGSMKLSGCVAGGLICKSQTWTRLK
jgi:uncharacterized protein (DUF2147 family)